MTSHYGYYPPQVMFSAGMGIVWETQPAVYPCETLSTAFGSGKCELNNIPSTASSH
jgi:hypothetical protein